MQTNLQGCVPHVLSNSQLLVVLILLFCYSVILSCDKKVLNKVNVITRVG